MQTKAVARPILGMVWSINPSWTFGYFSGPVSFKGASQKMVKNAKKEKLVSMLANDGNLIWILYDEF